MDPMDVRHVMVHCWFRRAVRSCETSEAHRPDAMAYKQVFCHAVHPKLANVDVIVNMSVSEGSRGPAQPATASASTERTDIKFTCAKCWSWNDARDAYARVSNRGTSKVWARVKLAGEDELLNEAFPLFSDKDNALGCP
jgi:hypothetical protein